MSTAEYTQFQNEGDNMYPPPAAPPGYSSQGAPPAGYPPQGAPPQGYPPQGAPPQGYPSQGGPPPGYPVPPQGYPSQGAYAPLPMGQNNCAPPPPVNVVVTAPSTQTIIHTTQIMPNDHFGLALFVCLCCFWPLGIVALIKSSEVRHLFNVGDTLGANRASEDARKYSMISLGIGLASVVISIMISIIYVIALGA